MTDPKFLPIKIFWISFNTSGRIDSLIDGRRGLIETRNLDDLFEISATPKSVYYQGGTMRIPSIGSLPQLVITHPEFSAEAFDSSGPLIYVSARLREALAFSEDEVQYIDVDDSLSLDSVRDQNFKILHVATIENAADPNLSRRFTWEEWKLPGIAMEQPAELPWSDIVLRRDWQPSSSIFRIANAVEGPFITAEAARRVEGWPDIGLRDPITLRG